MAMKMTTDLLPSGDKRTLHLERGNPILGDLKKASGTPSQGLHTDWMKSIPDERFLSQLSVPGTHDSAAYNYSGDGKEFWNCQSVPLLDQLEAGIRALDLRYAVHEERLLFFHSTALLNKHAEVIDIIWGLYAWLQEHPHETIFVSLKPDDGLPTPEIAQEDKAKALEEKMARVLEETKSVWVDNVTVKTTLGSARGKLVLIRRFPFSQNIGFSVSDGWAVNGKNFSMDLSNTSKAWIEDYYLLQHHPKDAAKQIGDKVESTEAHLDRAQTALAKNPNDLYITFSSAVGDRRMHADEDVTPRVVALGRHEDSGVNQALINWCRKSSKAPVGIVLMDFVTIKRAIPQKADEEAREETDFDLIRSFFEKQAP